MVVNTIIIITNNFMKRVYRAFDIDLCGIPFIETVIFPFCKKISQMSS